MAKLKYGIVGYPVKHSFSPAMHNAAFAELGIDAEYRLYEVAPDELESFLDGLQGKGISGLNVTIPHKIKAWEYIERRGRLEDSARRLGAVNTIKLADGVPQGLNTDGPGFYRSLQEELKFEPEGKAIFMLGSGGAASAIVMYLGSAPRKISVFDVDGSKTQSLRDRYLKYFDPKRLHIISDERQVRDTVSESDLLINATPIGMRESDPSPVDKTFLRAGMYVYDLVYNRPYTRLVKEANSMKAHAITGLGMLLYQGALSFEMWTGKAAPVGIMKASLKEAIKNQEARG